MKGMARSGLLLIAALALSGCAALTGAAPYKDALRRVGDVGPRIADDIRPTDAGGEARKAEFLRLCDEARRLGSE